MSVRICILVIVLFNGVLSAQSLRQQNRASSSPAKVTSNACDSNLAYCEMILGLPDHLQEELSLYPVPCNAKLHVKSGSEHFEMTLMDLTSNVLFQEVFYRNGPDAEVNTSELPNGIYFLRIRSPKIELQRKLMVRHQ